MRLLLPVSLGPFSLESALSALARAYEEYGVSSVEILCLEAEQTARTVALLAERLGLETGVVSLPRGEPSGGPDPLARALRKLVVEKLGEEAVAVVSPASRRLAAALALASMGSRVEVAHVHFYWGEWSGLPYPYTPRRLEPLVSLLPSVGVLEDPRNAAGRMPDLEREEPGWLKLSPLRRCVAELARRINASLPPCREGRAEKLAVEVSVQGGRGAWEADVCREGEVAGLVSGLSRFLVKRGWAEILAWTGLSELRLRGGLPGSTTIFDTTGFYQGVHNKAYRGERIAVPECAENEVRRRLAEAVKRGRLSDARSLKDALAFLALEEVLALGAPVYPSPPLGCDVAVTKIDPLLLDKAVIATGDDGAYRRWSRNPVSRVVASVAKTWFDPMEPGQGEGLSKLYYGFHQLLLVLALAEKNGLVDHLLVEAGGRRIRAPLKPVEDALGLEH